MSTGYVRLRTCVASPGGRALFTIGPGTDGEPLLTRLAIGYRGINPRIAGHSEGRRLRTVIAERTMIAPAA